MTGPEDARDTETLETGRPVPEVPVPEVPVPDVPVPEVPVPEVPVPEVPVPDVPVPDVPDAVSTVKLETARPVVGAAQTVGTDAREAGTEVLQPENALAPETGAEAPEAEDADAPETETTDADAPETETETAVASPARRWRRVCAVLVVVACVLAVAAVGAELFVRNRIESVVHGALPGLSEDAVVDAGGLVLPQVLTGSLDSLSVSGAQLRLDQSVGGVPLGSLDLHDVTATLSGIELTQPHHTDSLDASGTITWEDLAVIVRMSSPRLKETTLVPDELGTVTAPGTFTATAEVFGTDVVFLIVPSLTPEGNLLMTATDATFGGITFDLTQEDSLTMRLLGTETPEFVVDHAVLPAGTTFSAVVVTQEGLRVALSGQDLDLAPGH